MIVQLPGGVFAAPGDVVMWRRRRRGGARRVAPREVRIVGITPVGNVVVEYEFRHRDVRAIVSPSSLEAP